MRKLGKINFLLYYTKSNNNVANKYMPPNFSFISLKMIQGCENMGLQAWTQTTSLRTAAHDAKSAQPVFPRAFDCFLHYIQYPGPSSNLFIVPPLVACFAHGFTARIHYANARKDTHPHGSRLHTFT